MEDLSIEDLIADVVANPAPTGISSQSPQLPPVTAPAPTPVRSTVVGKIVKRITGRR
jgi:hypothetical protein